MTNVALEKSSAHQLLRKARLYCVTLPQSSFEGYEKMVSDACLGGADIIQLRDKNLSGKDLLAISKSLKAICAKFNALFIVNDRLDVALAAGADGVHLGQDDLPLPESREIVRRYFGGNQIFFLIGCSTHSLDQALKAQSEGADYLGCGPVFSTPTKPAYGAVGLELVREYQMKIETPFVAIGGIDATNIDRVIRAGARCVAVVRAAFESKNSAEASVRLLKSRFRGK